MPITVEEVKEKCKDAKIVIDERGIPIGVDAESEDVAKACRDAIQDLFKQNPDDFDKLFDDFRRQGRVVQKSELEEKKG